MAGVGQRRGSDLSNHELEQFVPGLTGSAYTVASPRSARYNCIAWAAQDERAWWWPDPMELGFWPGGAPRQETLEAFRLAFRALGFVECDTPDSEPGVEKIAIYTAADGRPTHVARQLGDGVWSSKLGRLQDITHDLSGLAGSIYGSPTLFMSRPI